MNDFKRPARPVTPGGIVGRSGDIEIVPMPDCKDHQVTLWNADGTMARRAHFATHRGADRVVQAWLRAGR